MNTVKFKHWVCEVQKVTYIHGNVALRLIDTSVCFDNIIAVASVNLTDLKPDEIAIKKYSENEGMYDALLEADIIEPAHRYTETNYIKNIPVCYLKKQVDD